LQIVHTAWFRHAQADLAAPDDGGKQDRDRGTPDRAARERAAGAAGRSPHPLRR